MPLTFGPQPNVLSQSAFLLFVNSVSLGSSKVLVYSRVLHVENVHQQ